jgi:prophage regulatory protein
MATTNDGERFLTITEVSRITTLCRSSIYQRLRRDTSFPRPVKLGASRIAWAESEIRRWMADRIAERDAA